MPKMPLSELIHNTPALSGRIQRILSRGSPSSEENSVNLPLRYRKIPSPQLPIHNVPSASAIIARADEARNSSTRRMLSALPPGKTNNPCPIVPTQILPARSSTMLRMSGEPYSVRKWWAANCSPNLQISSLVVPNQSFPALSSYMQETWWLNSSGPYTGVNRSFSNFNKPDFVPTHNRPERSSSRVVTTEPNEPRSNGVGSNRPVHLSSLMRRIWPPYFCQSPRNGSASSNPPSMPA